MNAAAVAIVLEARDGDVAAAGFRLACDQLRWDRADGLPPDKQRARFDEIITAVRMLEEK